MAKPEPTVLSFPDHWKIFPSAGGKPEALATAPMPGRQKMRILISDDDHVSREVLAQRLDYWGYDLVVTRDGIEALAELRKPDAPALAILDWMMPEMSGVEVCRRIRQMDKPVYVILLTARAQKSDIVEGLESGADDYLTKPFHKEELHARLQVGLRVLGLQQALADKVAELEAALAARPRPADAGRPLTLGD